MKDNIWLPRCRCCCFCVWGRCRARRRVFRLLTTQSHDPIPKWFLMHLKWGLLSLPRSMTSMLLLLLHALVLGLNFDLFLTISYWMWDVLSCSIFFLLLSWMLVGCWKAYLALLFYFHSLTFICSVWANFTSAQNKKCLYIFLIALIIIIQK